MPDESGEVRIRPAEIDDAPGLARVNVQSWQHAYRGILPNSFLDTLDVAASEGRWRDLLRFPAESRATFLAELTAAQDRPRAEVIGFATGGPERDGLVADGIAYDGEIYAVYLAPEHQRRGIGRLLLATTVRSLVRYGMKSIVIWALKDNHAARAFYEGLGGRVVGERTITIREILRTPGSGLRLARRRLSGKSSVRRVMVEPTGDAMKLTRYANAVEFLKHNRVPLEQEEAANNLILGIAGRVAEVPDNYSSFPAYFASIDEGPELLAAAVRTPPFNVVVYSARGADPEPLSMIRDDILEFSAGFAPDSPPGRVPGVVAHSTTALAFAELWSERTKKSFTPGMSQRIYILRRVAPPEGVPGQFRQARTEDLVVVADWVANFNVDASLPPLDMVEAWGLAERRVDAGDIFLWEEGGAPVSMAAKSRPTSHGITVSLVYTPPDFRNHGYASACVAALSQQLLDAGWDFCTLYTDLANPTSNSIYQRIGYRPVCDSNEYHFTTY